MENDFKIIEGDIVPIYENNKGEKLINARELHNKLENKRQFANWIKQRIEHYKFRENQDFIRFNNFVKGDEKGFGNKTIIEYKIIYERNTKNGFKGEVKEKGYRIEDICYKVQL